jgi:putative Holliday junction resolvase
MAVVLGLDYGLRRIGLALSDPTGTLATAAGCHRTPEDGSILDRLRGLVRERGVTAVVVGLPLTADGREAEMAAAARRFARRLADELDLPIHLVDERYSSQEADRWLRGASRRTGRDRGERDAVAAELILQQYLDAAGGDGGEAGP